MKNITKKFIDGGGLMIGVTLVANLLNFFFNAYLGRVLKFEEYGLVTILNTCWYLISIPMDSLMGTVIRETAYLEGKNDQASADRFVGATMSRALKVTLVCAILWAIASPFLSSFFHIQGFLPIFIFAPMIPIGIYTSVSKGYLMGSLYFIPMTIVFFAETVSKVVGAVGFVMSGYSSLAYVTISLSIVCSFTACVFMMRWKQRPAVPGKVYPFPKTYYVASIVTSLATIAFLTFDLILAKHFLTPLEAGKYALLSLVGKMIYFFGALPNQFTMTYVSRALGAERSPHRPFYIFFSGTVAVCIGAFITLGVFGNIFIPLLFGAKAAAIVPYLFLYSLALSVFTMAASVIGFHLARKQYIFSLLSIIISICMVGLILIFHRDISQIVSDVFAASVVCFIAVSLLHIAEGLGKFDASRMFTNVAQAKAMYI
jgi:O-antigen/teichoic acid export membrane protein